MPRSISCFGGFSSIIFENFNLQQIRQVRNITLEFQQFTTGNTHTAYIICRQVEQAKQLGLNYQTRLLPFAAPLVTLAVLYAAGDARTDVAELLLIARNPERLQELQSALGRGKIMGLEKRCPRQILWSGLLVCRRELKLTQLS